MSLQWNDTFRKNENCEYMVLMETWESKHALKCDQCFSAYLLAINLWSFFHINIHVISIFHIDIHVIFIAINEFALKWIFLFEIIRLLICTSYIKLITNRWNNFHSFKETFLMPLSTIWRTILSEDLVVPIPLSILVSSCSSSSVLHSVSYYEVFILLFSLLYVHFCLLFIEIHLSFSWRLDCRTVVRTVNCEICICFSLRVTCCGFQRPDVYQCILLKKVWFLFYSICF